jgi:hypothetical protein
LGIITMSSLSTQYVLVPVTSLVAGQSVSPVADEVQFAFAPVGSDPSAWTPGSWQDGTTNGLYVAQCLIGPANGGLVLAPGLYEIWVKVTDDPEVPVLQAGLLQVLQ